MTISISNSPRYFAATGTLRGYPWGKTVLVEAETIDEAQEEAESLLDTVVGVKEVTQQAFRTLQHA